METIIATHSKGEYPVYIGTQLLRQADLITRHIHGTQVLIVTNATIAPLYLEPVKNALSGFDATVMILPEGEVHKTMDTLNQLLDTLAQQQHHRDTTLIALGGGVIGDMTGFAAACYHRGVNFIQIPTSLLAQVDASIGGKTAVNHPQGKNLIGAFHQPQAVIIDIDSLQTLPQREFSAGLAEIIKAALIADADFFSWLETHLDALLQRDAAILTQAITTACTIKRDIVAQDETEQGVRALLNLGHTFGHAIEHCLGYGTWLHGEAVAMGTLLAAELSQQQGWLTAADVARIQTLFSRAQLPCELPQTLDAQACVTAMYRDKKVLQQTLRLILLKQIGAATIYQATDDAVLLDLYQLHRHTS